MSIFSDKWYYIKYYYKNDTFLLIIETDDNPHSFAMSVLVMRESSINNLRILQSTSSNLTIFHP